MYASNFRGYLSGVAAIEATGAITAGGVVTGTRLRATTAGDATAPAVALGVTGNQGLYERLSSAVALSVNGSSRLDVATGGITLQTTTYGTSIELTGYAAVGTYIELSQTTTPSAPAAGKVRVYNVDNGASKSQTRSLFDSGAAQAMQTEP